MHLHDPTRPLLASGVPFYVSPKGSKLGAVPTWYVNFEAGGKIVVSIMLAKMPRQYTWYEATCTSPEDFAALASAWASDPEATMESRFFHRSGETLTPYSRPEPLQAPPKITVTLADLGLD